VAGAVTGAAALVAVSATCGARKPFAVAPPVLLASSIELAAGAPAGKPTLSCANPAWLISNTEVKIVKNFFIIVVLFSLRSIRKKGSIHDGYRGDMAVGDSNTGESCGETAGSIIVSIVSCCHMLQMTEQADEGILKR
jgi:hypothetical protein